MTCPQFFLAWYSDEISPVQFRSGLYTAPWMTVRRECRQQTIPKRKVVGGITRRLRSRTRCTITPRHGLPVTLVPDICTHSIAGRGSADSSHYSHSHSYSHTVSLRFVTRNTLSAPHSTHSYFTRYPSAQTPSESAKTRLSHRLLSPSAPAKPANETDTFHSIAAASCPPVPPYRIDPRV